MVSGEVIGALLSIVSSIVSNFGVNLQKIAHSKNLAKPADEQVHTHHFLLSTKAALIFIVFVDIILKAASMVGRDGVGHRRGRRGLSSFRFR